MSIDKEAIGRSAFWDSLPKIAHIIEDRLERTHFTLAEAIQVAESFTDDELRVYEAQGLVDLSRYEVRPCI